MTWKRVATAVVLIPLVVSLVLAAPTGLVAVALASLILLALFEYFSLGEAVGHRAYRLWTATCAMLLIYVQFLAAMDAQHFLNDGPAIHRIFRLFPLATPSVADVLFIFLLGVAILTLTTRRPLVEGLPAAGISSSGLLLVALPLTFAVRLHGLGADGPKLLPFALVIPWVGDTVGYFVGRAIGKHPLAPHLSPKKTWEGSVASLAGSLLVGLAFTRLLNAPPVHLLVMAGGGEGSGRGGGLLATALKTS